MNNEDSPGDISADVDAEPDRQQLLAIDYEGLTSADVELLLDARELTAGSLDNARTRIRRRLRKTMVAFIAVWWGLGERDYQLLAERIRESRTRGRANRESTPSLDYLGTVLYTGLVDMLAVALKLARMAGIDREAVLEEALPRSDPMVYDAEVEITTFTPAQAVDPAAIKAAIERGDPVGLDEIGWLALQGDLSEDLLERIRDTDEIVAHLSPPDEDERSHD